ncbi:MAG: FAD:protein FMN transferase [Cytophagales bacterium]|nr:FAD:protein FMN transferase [Cytophagales bacterium]
MKNVFNIKRLFPLLVVLLLLIVWQYRKKGHLPANFHITGTTMGNIVYHVKYIDKKNGRNYKKEIDSLLIAFNQSLSTYIPDSEISKFNNTTLLKYESRFFLPVLHESKKIYEVTAGAFDPTVMPLVNAWGFGPDKIERPDSSTIDELKRLVGFDHIFFDSVAICKLKEGVKLDFSAIAKGYAVDLVLDFLDTREIDNIFVEIGGEVAAKGTNTAEGKPWSVGVEDPTKSVENRALFTAFSINNKAVATSGNYRNFYVLDGKKISHTISPYTGYPVVHSLLSASVFADKCIEADAYATAFMVLGLEKSVEIVEKMAGLEAFLIFSDPQGQLKTYMSDNLKAEILR